MRLDAAQLIGVVAVVCCAAFVQKISGFGFGLIVVPLLSLFLAPQEGVIIATLLGTYTTAAQAWTERSHCDADVAHRVFAGACVGMPVGLVLFVLGTANQLRLAVGVVVIVAGIMLARGFTLDHASRRDELLLGAVSGVLNTSVSTNGPPLVFLFQARGYEPHVFRGTISRVFVYSNIVSLALFVAAGKVRHEAALAAAASVPAVLLMQWAGGRVSPHVRGDMFRRLVLGLMFASGVSAIVAAATH